MKFIYNDSALKLRRKELRNNATSAEKFLWYYIKQNQIGGLRFFRQYSIGPYILDFYCSKIKLAIELDGGQHGTEEGILYDKERETYLQNFGVKVLRFWNNDVLKNIESVVEKIKEQI